MHKLLRLFLKVGINGCVDGKTGAVDRLGIVELLELGANIVDPVGEADRHIGRAELIVGEFNGRSSSYFGGDTDRLLGIADKNAALFLAGDHHQTEHLTLPGQRNFTVRENVIHRWRLDQARQEGCLGEGQLVGGGVEVGERGRLDAIRQIPVVILIEIQLQDFIFRIAACDLRGKQGFSNFAQVSPPRALLGGEEQVARDLLGDCGCSRDDVPGLEILDEGARDAEEIDTGVAVEGGIFRGDCGGDHEG